MLSYGFQKKIDNRYINDGGCYFLSLMQGIDRREEEIEDIYKMSVSKNYMDYECFVKEPTKLLLELTHKNWLLNVSKTFDSKADIIIAKWYNPRTRYSHFVLMDKNNNVLYDPLGSSVTVKEGYIESYRLFYINN